MRRRAATLRSQFCDLKISVAGSSGRHLGALGNSGACWETTAHARELLARSLASPANPERRSPQERTRGCTSSADAVSKRLPFAGRRGVSEVYRRGLLCGL